MIKKAAEYSDACIVAVSGGKDSVAVLDLCTQGFKTVYAYHMYIVKGLSFAERYLGYLEDRYKMSILRIPHFDLCRRIRTGYCRLITHQAENLKDVKQKHVESYVRQYFGAFWIAYGMRRSESSIRRAMLSKKDIDWKTGRIYPIADWKKQDVLNYMKLRGIIPNADYKYSNLSLEALSQDQILVIKEKFPEDYEKIKQVFPHIEALVYRWNKLQQAGIRLSGQKRLTDGR